MVFSYPSSRPRCWDSSSIHHIHLLSLYTQWIDYNTVSANRGFRGSIAIVIFGVIFNSKIKILPFNVAAAAVKAELPQMSVPGLILAGRSGDAAALMKIPGVAPAIIAAMTVAQANTYVDSCRYAWYALIPFEVPALIITLFVQSTKAQMTSQIESTDEHRYHQHLSNTL